MTGTADGDPTLEDQAVEQPPLDDIGADTLGRFRYQAELVARFAIAMLAGEPIDRIFCELHEDYVVMFSDSRKPCLVSVKHLESSQPRWTVHGLCNDGGVGHLYTRWKATERVASCLLQTNSGLRGGKDNPGELHEACRRGHSKELQDWATTLAPLIGADSTDDCREFLTNLRIEDHLPDRRHLRSSNLVEHMPRCLTTLAQSPSTAAVIYDIIVAEIEKASRNEIPDGAALAMADPERLEMSGAVRSMLTAKTITGGRLIEALEHRVSARQGPLMGVLTDPQADTPRRLVEKLRVGGIGPTGIRNARSLRLNWIGHRHRWSPDLPQAPDPFDDVEAKVLHAAHEAENTSRVAAAQYATAMETALIDRLTSTTIDVPGDPAHDLRLLLGCTYELTNQCHIYWSDEFEIGDPE